MGSYEKYRPAGRKTQPRKKLMEREDDYDQYAPSIYYAPDGLKFFEVKAAAVFLKKRLEWLTKYKDMYTTISLLPQLARFGNDLAGMAAEKGIVLSMTAIDRWEKEEEEATKKREAFERERRIEEAESTRIRTKSGGVALKNIRLY